ncbi:hypothetical protein JG688_00010799, partial [Phytophthora aleatoria]
LALHHEPPCHRRDERRLTNAAVIDHDTVVPFAQPTPTTTLQTLAVQFKSQIYPAGETQDLIMWDHLTDAARTPLEDTDFGDANVSFKDANFETKLGNNLLTLCITYVAR